METLLKNRFGLFSNFCLPLPKKLFLPETPNWSSLHKKPLWICLPRRARQLCIRNSLPKKPVLPKKLDRVQVVTPIACPPGTWFACLPKKRFLPKKRNCMQFVAGTAGTSAWSAQKTVLGIWSMGEHLGASGELGGASGGLWGASASSGDIWGHLGTFGSSGESRAFGGIWGACGEHLGASGELLHHLGPSGELLHHLGPPGEI